MLELIKKSFEIWVKKQWLKEIDNALNKSAKTYDKYKRECLVVQRLVDEYRKKFPDEEVNRKVRTII